MLMFYFFPFKFIAHVVDEMMFPAAKASRTKLYSGRANHCEPKLFSLQDLCLRVLSENVAGKFKILFLFQYFIILI